MGLLGRRNTRNVGGTGLRSLTAAAALIDANDKANTDWYRKRLSDWVVRAWQFYNQVPEVRAAARYFGDGMSRLGLYAGIRADPYSDPTPLNPEGDKELGYTAEDAALALETVAALKNPHGGPAEIMRRLGLQLYVAGEALLMGREDEDFGERWDVYSTRELQLNDGKWELLKPSDGGSSRVDESYTPDEVVVLRVWRPHPEFTAWADAPMQSAEMILEELLVLTKAIQAVALSRISGAGILFLPNSIRNMSANQTDGTSGGMGAARDTVVADIITAAATAISDPGSAASQVPLTIWVPDNVYDQISSDKLIRWSRELDDVMETQRQSLLDRFAVTADIPTAELKDKSGINHWGMWAIPEDAFRTYFEPVAVLIVNGLTSRYFTPALREAGAESLAERVVIWYDPSALVSPPDQSADYKMLYDRFELSGDALRRSVGASDDDKPDDDEIARRLEWGQRPASEQQGPDRTTPGPTNVPGEQRAITASAVAVLEPPVAVALPAGLTVEAPTVVPIDGLAETLGSMDATLMRDLLVNADAAFRRALERANQRIKSLTRGNQTLAAKVKDLAASDLAIAPALGPKAVGQLAAGEDLMAGAFDQLGVEFRRRTGRTAEETIRLAVLHGELSESEAAVLRDQLDDDRNAGWLLLLAAMLAIGTEKLYRPLPDEGPGEVSDLLLPPAIVRASLARAGGGGQDATSMLTGGTVSSIFRQAKIAFKGWRWVYGDPSARLHPFEAHKNLERDDNGKITIYSGPDDPKLRNRASFPSRGSYWPNDHKGCLCRTERVAAVKLTTTTITPTREVA